MSFTTASKNEIYQDKFKKTCTRPINRTLQKFAERKKKTINGELYMCVDRKLNILKTAILPKLIHRFTATPIKISVGFLKIPKS